MSTAKWISLIIVLASIGCLVFAIIKAKKQVQPTLDAVKDLKESINLEIKHYTQEASFYQQMVEALTQKITQLKDKVNSGTLSFEYFQERRETLENTLDQLKTTLPKIAKNTSQSVWENVKRDGPQIWETFKLAIKKTFQKQRTRFSK